MLARMSWAQLSEWILYFNLEPFGEERDDLRTGIVASTLANIHRDPKKPAFKPSDFMLFKEGLDGKKVPSRPEQRRPLTSQTEWAKFKETIKATAPPRMGL